MFMKLTVYWFLQFCTGGKTEQRNMFVCVLFWLLHKDITELSASSTVYIYERDDNGVKADWVCIITSLGLWIVWSAHNSLSILDDVCFILRDVKQMLTECIDIWIINVFI
jgi:hypothetical protein